MTSVRTSQPQDVPKINPLFERDLVCAYLPNIGRNIVDPSYIPAVTGTFTTGPSRGFGMAHQFSNGEYTAILDESKLSLTEFTALILRRPQDTTNVTGSMFGNDFISVDGRCHAHAPFIDGTTYFDFGSASGDGRITWGGYSKDVKVLDRWVFKMSASEGQAIWYNGIERATGNANSRDSEGSFLYLNRAGSTGGDNIDIYLACIWNRYLSDAETYALTVNETSPWGVFAPQLRSVSTLAAAGGVEITAVTGEVSVEGFAAAVTTVYEPTAVGETGEVSVEGFAATVTAISGVDVTGVTGEVNVEGFAATVETSIEVKPSTGEVSVEGFAPTISIHGRAVTAITGEVSVEGFAPTVTALTGFTVTPITGEVSVEGFAAAAGLEKTARPSTGELQVLGFAGNVVLIGRPKEERPEGGGSGLYDELLEQIKREDEMMLSVIKEFVVRAA